MASANQPQNDNDGASAGAAWTSLSRDDVRQLLLSLVGYTYGEKPEQNLPLIRAGRMAYAQKYIHLARVCATDKVMDLGSGCGFGTRAIAQQAAHVFACDISPAYLDFARQECADVNNISFVSVQSRDLSAVPDGSVDVVIAMSVFVHLNLYDIHWYFKEFRRVLPVGGRVCLDFANMHSLFPSRWRQAAEAWLMRLRGGKPMQKSMQAAALGNSDFFLDHAAQYRHNPHQLFALMQWNSATGIRRVARHHGFHQRRRNGDRLLFVRVC